MTTSVSAADEPLPADAQAPLGPQPDYDAVLDLAVEYSFPCSDPIAVDACCGGIAKRNAAADLSRTGDEPSAG
jgi:hypothetical protein